MKTNNPELAKIFAECTKKAKKETNICMYPGCSNKAIKSHILQKNGILSSTAPKKHLWESVIKHFDKEYISFKKTGINNVYTFLGFCNKHDSSVFRKIESDEEINFNDYESNLLFALRTACNEYRTKEIIIKQEECIYNNPKTQTQELGYHFNIQQNKLALKDLAYIINAMWHDLAHKTESFIFQYRELEYIEICLNSIYTYETSQEIENYIKQYNKNIDRTSEIFISLFPYNNKSILIMGYHKNDKEKLKPFVNMFFKENEKRLERRLSSLLIFNCENWICSEKLFDDKFLELDSEFHKAAMFSSQNKNERKTFNLNVFSENFRHDFKNFIKRNIG